MCVENIVLNRKISRTVFLCYSENVWLILYIFFFSNCMCVGVICATACMWRSETTLDSVLFYLPVASQNQSQVARFVVANTLPVPIMLILKSYYAGHSTECRVLLLSYKVDKEWEGIHSWKGSWDGKITKKLFVFICFESKQI